MILELHAVSGDWHSLGQHSGMVTDWLGNFPFVLAQNIEDPDILGDMQAAFENFIESGQAWALGIGLFLGYFFRSLTAS